MLAGCSSSLRSDPTVQFKARHFQIQKQMNAQRFDLPCNLSRREILRASLSLEKGGEAKPSSCSFRPNPVSSSSSIAAHSSSLEKGRSLKRYYESSSFDEPLPERSKKKRTAVAHQLVVGGGDEDFWLQEEKAYFVPNADIFQPQFSSRSALLESLGGELLIKGEDEEAGTSEWHNANSGSSSSADSGGSSKLNDDSSENETENGVRTAGGESSSQEEHQGLELVELLTACASSVGSSDHTAINYYIARLGELASPTRTPIHRLAAYFTESLAIRVAKTWPHIFSISPPGRDVIDVIDEDNAGALQLLNQVSPIPKFIHFTLNERLLQAFEGQEKVHIIDFDIKQGLQWPSLFQSLASRPNPPSHVRITGIGDSKQDLQDTGNRLASIAEALNLAFEFHPVVDRLEDVRLWMLHVKEKECVAVNCIFQLHKVLESQGALMDLLGLIRSTNPSIVLVAEQEAEHNEAKWEKRFANALKYYAAIFDVVDYSLPEVNTSSAARIKIEEMFARKIRNIVACEGAERFERHEVFDTWRRLMEDGGFRGVGLGEREEVQSKMLLRMYSCEDCYSVVKQGGGDGGGLTLKWFDQPLYTVSAWVPVDIASSSSKSQPG